MRSPKIRTHPYKKIGADDIDVIIGVLWLLAVVRLLPFGQQLRGILPEPFDVFDHVSNLVLSISMSYYLTLISAKLLHGMKINPQRALIAARSIVMPSMIGLNLLFETQSGRELIGSSSTPDGIDFAYGAIGTVLGVLIIRVDSKRDRA